MSLPQKLQLTFRANGFDPSRTTQAIEIFHSWITRRALDEVLVDVADYRHVPQGPGIVLVGLESNYNLSNPRGRFQLSCFNKRDAVSSDPLVRVVSRTLRACQLLQEAFAVPGLRFDVSQLELSVIDRRATDFGGFDAQRLAEATQQQLSAMYGSAPVITPLEGSSRPTLSAHWSAPQTISDVLQRIESGAVAGALS